jgi:hypothetical protein
MRRKKVKPKSLYLYRYECRLIFLNHLVIIAVLLFSYHKNMGINIVFEAMGPESAWA